MRLLRRLHRCFGHRIRGHHAAPMSVGGIWARARIAVSVFPRHTQRGIEPAINEDMPRPIRPTDPNLIRVISVEGVTARAHIHTIFPPTPQLNHPKKTPL